MSRKDYRLDIKVRNNNLLSAIEAKGYTSIPKFAAAHGLQYTYVLDYINMTRSLFGKDGNLQPLVERLMVVLEKRFDELFNERQIEGLDANKATVEVTTEQMFVLMNPTVRTGLSLEDDYCKYKLIEVAQETLSQLSPREQRLINQRFGLQGPEMTIEAIANSEGVTIDNVRQSISKALTRLRHPVRSEKLRSFIGSD